MNKQQIENRTKEVGRVGSTAPLDDDSEAAIRALILMGDLIPRGTKVDGLQARQLVKDLASRGIDLRGWNSMKAIERRSLISKFSDVATTIPLPFVRKAVTAPVDYRARIKAQEEELQRDLDAVKTPSELNLEKFYAAYNRK